MQFSQGPSVSQNGFRIGGVDVKPDDVFVAGNHRGKGFHGGVPLPDRLGVQTLSLNQELNTIPPSGMVAAFRAAALLQAGQGLGRWRRRLEPFHQRVQPVRTSQLVQGPAQNHHDAKAAGIDYTHLFEYRQQFRSGLQGGQRGVESNFPQSHGGCTVLLRKLLNRWKHRTQHGQHGPFHGIPHCLVC